jgi:hypothetical protein
VPAPREVLDLVARFEQQLEAYRSGQYNETQVRREFLDPFFKALGWDIDNVQGFAEAYKDVIHEDQIRVGGATKAPDYCFRIGGTRKYFLKAKKPSIAIKDEPAAAYQLRRYAWSAKLPLSKLVGDILDCGGKRSATPLSDAPAEKAVSPLRSATALQDSALPARTAAAILNRVAKLRILDPACGSGSFLIGAYQWLLDWHLRFYLANDPVRWAKETRGRHPVLVHGRKGEWQLSIAERKRILLANIYGVDIDAQAVEVTKLSLLLKVLEGESAQAQIYFALKDRVLPDLGDNIKCGNSLIGPDFYQQSEPPLLTDEERYRINVFDWKAEFPEVFGRDTSPAELQEAAASPLDYTMPGVPLHGSYRKTRAQRPKVLPPVAPGEEGGFDAVIGNPPYVQIENIPPTDREYFIKHYGENGTLGKR